MLPLVVGLPFARTRIRSHSSGPGQNGCHTSGIAQTYVLKKNAGDVRFREGEFDLLVCDMSWSPKLMSRLVSDLLYSLQSGGTAVVTVKLLHKKPLALIKEVIDTFERSRMQIQRSKQLFHNREEITLYMIKY